jgi:hypothetical protein
MRGAFCSVCSLQLTGRLRKYCRDHSRQASTLLKRQYRRDEKAKGVKYWLKEWAKKTDEERRAYFRNYRREYRRRRAGRTA